MEKSPEYSTDEFAVLDDVINKLKEFSYNGTKNVKKVPLLLLENETSRDKRNEDTTDFPQNSIELFPDIVRQSAESQNESLCAGRGLRRSISWERTSTLETVVEAKDEKDDGLVKGVQMSESSEEDKEASGMKRRKVIRAKSHISIGRNSASSNNRSSVIEREPSSMSRPRSESHLGKMISQVDNCYDLDDLKDTLKEVLYAVNREIQEVKGELRKIEKLSRAPPPPPPPPVISSLPVNRVNVLKASAKKPVSGTKPTEPAGAEGLSTNGLVTDLLNKLSERRKRDSLKKKYQNLQ